MEIKTFGVIGAGQMGNGIAQVAAASGLDVIMHDITQEFVDKGLKTIGGILARNVEKGKMTAPEKDALLGRIKGSTSLKDMAAADFVVEAATEKEDIKFQIFRDLDRICKPGSDPGHQHLVHPHRPYRRSDPPAGQGHRHALHEPGAGHEARGSHPRPADLASDTGTPPGRWPKSSARPRPNPTTTPGSSPTAFCCR